MTQSSAGDPASLPEAKLGRRDWLLLPLLGPLTLVLMAVSSEFVARRYFGESKTSLNNCLVLNDAATGVRGIPNPVCWEKIPESPLIEYKLDCSGFRTGMACGPKPPGTYRIVRMGSSVAMGERVPIENTFATLLPNEISPPPGRRAELYNEAMGYGFPRNTVLRFDKVLAAKPAQIACIFAALSATQWLVTWLGIWLCSTAVLALWEWLRAALLSIKTAEGPLLTSRYARVVYATAFGAIALVITFLLNQPAPVIVYKAF